MASKATASRKKTRAGAIRPGSVLMLAIMYVIACIVAVTALSPKRYDLTPGAVAPETIRASRAIEDSETTSALREAAKASVSPVYQVNEETVTSLVNGAREYFEDLAQIRSDAEQIRQDASMTWNEALTEQDIATLCSLTTPALTESQLFALLSASASDVTRLEDLVLPKISTTVSGGLTEENVSKMREACKQEINATTLAAGLKQIGAAVVDRFVSSTVTLDEAATESAREAAAENVETLVIKQGEVIVEKGATVTEAQYEVLRQLEMISTEASDLPLDAGICLYLLLIFGAFGAYLMLYAREIMANGKSMAILTSAVSLSLALALLCSAINTHITLGLVAVILTTLLVSEGVALVLSVVLALCIGLVSGGRGTAMLQFTSTVMTASFLLSGWTAVYTLRHRQNRGSVIASGGLAGLAAAFTTLACDLLVGKTAIVILEDAGWAFGSAVVSAVLCVGTMSVWENLFGVATNARLSELSNTSNPLLKQLLTEAPGTYHHSTAVAALAEAAAGTVGANPLLSRVGALYHDVGKLRRPLYFRENQKNGENIHDTLTASESAQFIIAHQKDGVTILNKYKMPSAVVQIAYEHHGSSVMSYFYHKATQEQPNKTINPKLFRYPGARPSTKESAIVMLSDSCEAAVRSLGDADREAVEKMVKKVIRGIVDSGQLDASPLTLSELSEIERSFLRTFAGLRHERIEYPDMKKPEAEAQKPEKEDAQ